MGLPRAFCQVTGRGSWKTCCAPGHAQKGRRACISRLLNHAGRHAAGHQMLMRWHSRYEGLCAPHRFTQSLLTTSPCLHAYQSASVVADKSKKEWIYELCKPCTIPNRTDLPPSLLCLHFGQPLMRAGHCAPTHRCLKGRQKIGARYAHVLYAVCDWLADCP